MSGGLIQLVAYGAQDLFLTSDPQITFFKIVYRRHTNFTLEVIPQDFIHTPDFGKRVTCVLSRNGDLIKDIHVSIQLPTIPQFINDMNEIDVISKFAWVRRIGYAIIGSVEMEIGGELIDRQYGDWLNIWYDLTESKYKNLDKMLGDVKELTNFTNGKQSYQLFVPLQFWFNRIPGLALPIVSLQYNHIKINLQLNDFDNCYIVTPSNTFGLDNDFVNFIQYEFIQQTANNSTSLAKFVYFDILTRTMYLARVSDNGFQSLTVTNPDAIATEAQQKALLYAKDPAGNLINAQYLITGLTSGFQAMPTINATEIAYTNTTVDFSSINLTNCFLLVNYVFLDDDERIRFSQARHEYLIDQIFYNGAETINGLQQSYTIGFTQPCKEIVWVSQLNLSLNNRNNDIFNYTDSLITDANGNYIGKNIILQETILFNGHERISLRSSDYFSKIQPYQHHTHNPQTGINVYSFALSPEKHQPSGSANLSKIDNATLRIIVGPLITFNFTAQLRIYGVAYNILRIANGISGIVFSIDYEY